MAESWELFAVEPAIVSLEDAQVGDRLERMIKQTDGKVRPSVFWWEIVGVGPKMLLTVKRGPVVGKPPRRNWRKSKLARLSDTYRVVRPWINTEHRVEGVERVA